MISRAARLNGGDKILRGKRARSQGSGGCPDDQGAAVQINGTRVVVGRRNADRAVCIYCCLAERNRRRTGQSVRII